MSRLKQRLNIKTNGNPRSLLVIEERPKGDVYIRLKSGTQVGIPPNETKVQEHRYSLHYGDQSAENSTFKRTLKLVDGRESTLSQVSDVIKSKDGILPLFIHRASDLAAPVYDLRDPNKGMTIGDFDPADHTLLFAIFVTNPNFAFPEHLDGTCVLSLQSTYFKIVMLYVWNHIPSLPSSRTFDRATFPAGEEDDGLRKMMKGGSIDRALNYFSVMSTELSRQQLWETYHLIDDPGLRAFIKDQIDSIPPGPIFYA